MTIDLLGIPVIVGLRRELMLQRAARKLEFEIALLRLA